MTTIDLATLAAVVGGLGNNQNTDSRTSAAGGLLYQSQTRRRTDDAYRLDAIRQACTDKNTAWWGGVDRAKAADCFLTEAANGATGR